MAKYQNESMPSTLVQQTPSPALQQEREQQLNTNSEQRLLVGQQQGQHSASTTNNNTNKSTNMYQHVIVNPTELLPVLPLQQHKSDDHRPPPPPPHGNGSVGKFIVNILKCSYNLIKNSIYLKNFCKQGFIYDKRN